MKFNKDLINQPITGENLEKEVAYFEPEFIKNRCRTSLNGDWRFVFCDEFDEKYLEENFDISELNNIKVPSHIELNGYDRPKYVNVMYPWEGTENLKLGEVPKNTNSNKGSSGQKTVISQWGKYGRVNDSRFSGDTSSYPYEPELPKILGANKIAYNEMDFGTTGGYTNSNSNGTKYTQTLYNTGSKISRGAARMVYVVDKNVKSIDERHVFYKYNHYNDFQEYLNYYNGWGIRFGNQSAGNEYCGNSSDYYALKCVPPTKYPEVLLKKYSEIN